MKETWSIRNVVAMLDGLCKDGLVKESMKLFVLMREKGLILEVLCTLLWLMASAKQTSSMMQSENSRKCRVMGFFRMHLPMG